MVISAALTFKGLRYVTLLLNNILLFLALALVKNSNAYTIPYETNGVKYCKWYWLVKFYSSLRFYLDGLKKFNCVY